MFKKKIINQLNTLLNQTVKNIDKNLSKTQINNIEKTIKFLSKHGGNVFYNPSKTSISGAYFYIFGINFSDFLDNIENKIEILGLDKKILENNKKDYYKVDFYKDVIKDKNDVIKIYKYKNEFVGIKKIHFDLCSKVVNSNDLLYYDGEMGFMLKNNNLICYIMKENI